ncbi:AAA family ATPase [Thermohalobacter berrensis]|uniref:Bacterial transcriptional activator domain-containing protein n=1 Tax=Thermohalobacter berrensis TaxID=99594 RepID=A0A419T5W7_9FIRM|nr:AAA family ATPase [Thermohalobacter berrensis]RKD32934.1 hypothetical protein BET03_09970 [Thermohalobacter berrensis]
MAEIYVKIFNTPMVQKNGEKVSFPLRKAEALFYYLVVNKQATRDELVNLLWGNLGDKSGRKNLRNTMYRVRKAFDLDVIISPQQQIVTLNPDIKINSDLETFLNDNEDNLKAYTGEFLQGFAVKNAKKFEEWMLSTREYYKQLYINKVYKNIEFDLKDKKYDSIEKWVKTLINLDEFDEKAYRILMKIYAEKEAYNKAIEVYNRLFEILKTELGVEPDVKTKELFREILEMKSFSFDKNKDRPKSFFYGREKELNLLRKNYLNFINSKESKSVVIMGEAGIGKTALKDKFIEQIKSNNIYILETNCYQVEKDYFLRPWNLIFSKLLEIIKSENIDILDSWKNVVSYLFPGFLEKETGTDPIRKIDTLKFGVIEETIINILKKVSTKKKILFIIEDLQWIDKMSLSLLTSILLHIKNNNVMFIGTLRNGYEKEIDKFLALMGKYNIIEKIYLERFSKKETKEIINKTLPKHMISKELQNMIYSETEGNTFFLVEFLKTLKEKGTINVMSSKMKDILKTRFLDISENGRKLIDVISIFFDEAPLDILKETSEKDELEILDIMDELKSKYIIKEIVNLDKISFKFTHQKLRDFIYEEQSLARRKVLHNKIGLILENTLKGNKSDVSIYPKLIYHFQKAGNLLLALKYSIKNISIYLNFSHELFPELDINLGEKNKYLNIDKEESLSYLKDIEKLLQKVKQKDGITKEVKKLEIVFFHMMGRYLIKEGEYEKGIGYIQKVIKKSEDINEYKYILKGYRQMIYYCIQTYNIQLMDKYLKLGLDLAKRQNFKKDIGILLRLKGLNKIMKGEYQEAEELLKESIRIFNMLDKGTSRYLVYIAAAYNYIGDIRRNRMEFSNSLNYFNKAISICENKNILRGLSIFNTRAGQAAFDMGDYKRSREYLRKALNVYNKIDLVWGKAIAQGYMAMIYVKEAKYVDALDYLKKAEENSQKLKNPYEIGLIYRVKAEIKSNMANNEELNKSFSQYLQLPLEKYCEEGITFLKKVKDCYEMDILKALKK